MRTTASRAPERRAASACLPPVRAPVLTRLPIHSTASTSSGGPCTWAGRASRRAPPRSPRAGSAASCRPSATAYPMCSACSAEAEQPAAAKGERQLRKRDSCCEPQQEGRPASTPCFIYGFSIYIVVVVVRS